jgi:MOSC domain-containing protein YiiM
MMRLISVQVGKPKNLGSIDPGDLRPKVWRSGYDKAKVHGPIFLGETNLDGDGQADKRYHGGSEMAVLAYSAGHYPRWREELAMPDLPYGAFAENFTVSGVDEQSACLGDIWEVGEARLQICQPRKPCNNISKFWGRAELLKRVIETGRYGWYFRVLKTGLVEAGQEIHLTARPQPAWSIARAMKARLGKSRDPQAAAALAALPELGEDWRARLGIS